MSDDPVRGQYEAYPYPARDAADESRRLITGSPSELDELNHYVFAGRRAFRRPFRALVAGGGTGDGAIMLAQQLADAGPGRVVYADSSRAARAVAEARARARGLGNLSFHTLVVEDLAAASLGPFDYIDCCGVLHHLKDPAAGLACLAGELVQDGGLGVMVYGELGRTGIYPAQDLIRLVAGSVPLQARVRLARRLVNALPETNWLRRNPFVGDYLTGGDAGLVDLLLSPRDRAFRVPGIAALAAAAGLRITAFVEPTRYDPASYVRDAHILKGIGELAWIERCAAAELISGNMRKHVFYAVKAINPGPWVASPEDEDAVPRLRLRDGEDLVAALAPGAALRATVDGIRFRFPMPPLARAIVERIDGTRPLAAIHDELRVANPRLERARFMEQFRALYAGLNGLGKLHLRRVAETGPASP